MPYRKRRSRFSPTDWERLGRAVRRARALSELTQPELARAARVSKDVIERLERIPHSGSEILMTNLYKIENALGWEAGECERILLDTASMAVTDPVVTRRARILEQIRQIPGVGAQEIEVMMAALDQEVGSRS